MQVLICSVFELCFFEQFTKKENYLLEVLSEVCVLQK